jgi:trehalose 6-phosphate synthase
VVAVRSLLKRNGGIWFGWSGTVFVVTDLTATDYEEYYNGFANRVLWPASITASTLRNFPAAI